MRTFATLFDSFLLSQHLYLSNRIIICLFLQAKLLDLLSIALYDIAEYDPQEACWLSFSGTGWQKIKVVV